MKPKKLTLISVVHYIRLAYRTFLFLAVLFLYVRNRILGIGMTLMNMEKGNGRFILTAVWLVFMVEMIFRFFPSKIESPGCQKQFPQNYQPSGRTDVELHDNSATMIVALVWVAFNLIPGWLYMNGIIDEGIIILLCLAYSVCDMVCILFFCPFQTWFLKNRCCVVCRIYNWDYAMMFTPLFFINNVYSWTLLAEAILLLFRWEISVWRFPERFSENTNCSLKCANCSEKLCTHKKQLLVLRENLVKYTEERIERITKTFGGKP